MPCKRVVFKRATTWHLEAKVKSLFTGLNLKPLTQRKTFDTMVKRGGLFQRDGITGRLSIIIQRRTTVLKAGAELCFSTSATGLQWECLHHLCEAPENQTRLIIGLENKWASDRKLWPAPRHHIAGAHFYLRARATCTGWESGKVWCPVNCVHLTKWILKHWTSTVGLVQSRSTSISEYLNEH